MKFRKTLYLLICGVPLLYFVTLKTHRTHSGDGDEPHYLIIAESLIDDGDLNLRNQYPDKHSFIIQAPWIHHAVVDRFGGLYPTHDIGLPIFLVPALAAVHWLIPRLPAHFFLVIHMAPVKFTMTMLAYQSIVVTCILSLLFFHYLLMYGWQATHAAGATLLCILTMPIAAFGYLFFTEIYSAMVIVGLVSLLMANVKTWRTAVFSVGLFLLLWLHVRNLPICLIACILWMVKRQNSFPILTSTYLTPAVVLCLGMMSKVLLNWYYLGKFTLSALSTMAGWNIAPFSSDYISVSAFAMAFDREVGIIWSNPLFLFLPVGLAVMIKGRHSWCLREGMMVLAYFLLVFSFRDWGAGWSPPGRYLVPIMPILWIPVFEGVGFFLRHGRRLIVGLALSGAAIVSILEWSFPKSFWMSENGVNPWMSHLAIGGWEWQNLLPSFYQPGSIFFGAILLSTIFSMIIPLYALWIYWRTSSAHLISATSR